MYPRVVFTLELHCCIDVAGLKDCRMSIAGHTGDSVVILSTPAYFGE